MKNCKSCKKEFEPHRENQKFCSNYCYKKYWQKGNAERCRKYKRDWYRKQKRHCKLCHKEINRVKMGFNSSFCSKKCRQQNEKIANKKYVDKRRKFLRDYKLSRGCARCGYSVCSGALDFHHLEKEREKKIINSAYWTLNSERMKKERTKCIVLCKNCHAEIHNGISFNANALERTR